MRLGVLGNHGPYPAPGMATSGYLLTKGETAILIDCGSGVLSRLIKRLDDVSKLTAVIISHLHADHIADLAVLRYMLQSMKARGVVAQDYRLPVYLPQDDSPGYHYATEASDNVFEQHKIFDRLSKRIGGINFTFWAMRHPVTSFGMRIEDEGKVLCYNGDTNWHDHLAAFARDADVLLAAAGFLHENWNENLPHLSARLCARQAREAGVKRLVLTHFPPHDDPLALLEEARSEFENTYLSQERQEIFV
ncbi:MAG: MBL fold metallo-hydrolase [Christensenellales bacterium]|jgi:ribonuclease BN (tRNA processing enzyme)